ncbi:hypothetical protein BPAE_0015g00050 [Botrytis paeoniae]|uniref:Fungal N-terminal domain-containing protein n=1 Tax=Botrytis paeoniae TaxID=278948 RepID=A0A4Z1G5P7_9HELO|nr:hypothetical protein BPAE_0015g00050 [Botrytis paeoniae]
MALEVIGGIASILQLAGTVYTISKTLYEVGEALSNAPSDIKDLTRDLETFSDELHLLSTLLHGKDGRYADQLSLMGILSVLSVLRVDNMMDSLGINNPSLIGGPNRHGLSTETRMQVEDTRLKLAGMSMKDTTGVSSGSKPMLSSSVCQSLGGSNSTLSTSATSATYVGPPTTRVPSTASFSASSFLSMAVVPDSMPPILNTHANQSVDSFHSALLYQNQDSLDGQMKQVESFLKPEDLNHVPVILQSVMVSDGHDRPSFPAEESRQLDISVSKSLKSWRNEMALSAMKHFNMNTIDAEEWAKHLPVPSSLLATTEPTNQAETSLHLRVESKPQKIGRYRLEVDFKEAPSHSDANHHSHIFTPPAAEAFRYNGQNHQIDAVLGSSMAGGTHFSEYGDDGPLIEEVDGYDGSPAYSPASPVYSSMEADSSPIQADTTLLSFTGGKKCPNNSKFMDEPAIIYDWPLIDKEKMTPSSSNSTGLESNDVTEYHGYNTNFTEQANLSSQVLSGFGSDRILQNVGLPRKLDLPVHEMQLRLLEVQNNRRLKVAKREQQNSYQQSLETSHQANLGSPLPQLDIPANELAYRGYQRQSILIEKENKDRLVFTQQKQQSSTQQPRRIQTQHQQQQQQQQRQQQQQQQQRQQQQQQQQQQQMAQLSPHRRLGVIDRVLRVDFERWRNVDACQSMEISANIPSGLCELGTEDLLPKPQPQEIQMQSQASQKAYKRGGQPSYLSMSLCGKSEPRGPMEFPLDYTNGISGQVFKSPKSDESNDISIFHFQNEISNKGLGGFWLRGLINVESFDAVIWRNLQQYLNRERVYTTLEVGSNPLVANLDWSATPSKERITLRRQMLPRAASSIQKILDVLAVMEETTGLKIGAIAWACLLGAVENLLSLGPNWTADSQIRIITEMSEIVSIIARYTVLENIYAQRKGMSLDKDYEKSLINLSTHVLIYLGAFVPSLSESNTNADMKPYFDKIIEADTACRGFTVIVSAENTTIDRKCSFEEFSDDSDDTENSDGTILGVDGNDEVNNMPSSAKRIKL